MLCTSNISYFTDPVHKGNLKFYLGYLVKNWVLSFESSAGKLKDLLIASWFLCSKLIAWKSQNLQTCIVHRIM